MCDFVTTESSRCLNCKNPKCREGCPIHYNSPLMLQYAKAGQLDKAAQTVGHIFGEVCGYICPRDKQCKGHCVLGVRNAPVDVGRVEREVFERAFPQIVPVDDELADLKVAVVGGGVGGLTFAEQCVRHGADVTVFEKCELLHTLRSIPSFRLPKAALQRIVDAVAASPIKVVKKAVTSSDIEAMQADFDMVYLSVGVTVPHKMGVVGEELVTSADAFLRAPQSGETLIVGGGNTAMDCARLSQFVGNKTTIAYRRTRADMPAFEQEISAAEEDGVAFCYNLAPVSVARQNGRLVATFAKTVSEGRGRLVVTDEQVVFVCDNIVVATGSAFDKSVFATEKFVPVDGENRVHDNLFAGGDCAGKSLAVQAVADALNAVKTVLMTYKR